MFTAEKPPYYTAMERRVAREVEYGVTCYELQAMLEVDHADWPQHTAEMDYRNRNGLAYSQAETDCAITMIHQWVRESGIDSVRESLTETITARRNHDGSRRVWYAPRFKAGAA